jgi:hypothetical protein
VGAVHSGDDVLVGDRHVTYLPFSLDSQRQLETD